MDNPLGSHSPAFTDRMKLLLRDMVPCQACHAMGFVGFTDEGVAEGCKACGGIGYVKPEPKPNAAPAQPQEAA
jgi:hypothetical protein